MQLGDISNYQDMSDWTYILLGILVVDVAVLFLTRYFPDFLGKNLNIWYEKFGLSAVLADVFIIAIGFAIARYVYAYFVPNPQLTGFNVTLFLAILVITQVIHDLIFYFGIVKPIPKGHNRMIDVFKAYGEQGGGKILLGDAGLMLGSAFVAMALKEQPTHVTASVALLTVYALPYILETKNKFSQFD